MMDACDFHSPQTGKQGRREVGSREHGGKQEGIEIHPLTELELEMVHLAAVVPCLNH